MSLVGAADSVVLTGGLETIFTDTKLRICVENVAQYSSKVRNWDLENVSLLKSLMLELQHDRALPSGLARKLVTLVSAIVVDGPQRDISKADFVEFCANTVKTMRSSSFFDQWSRKMARDSKLCFATVSSAGRSILRESGRFDCIIVDEASQATEAETNILFMLNADKIVLVGDPAQLAGTVASQSAKRAGFDRSLFERALQAGISPMLLDVQYRMHDQIAKFSNQHFYRGALKTATPESAMSSVLAPLTFFDISGIELGKSPGHDGESLSNEAEAQVIGEIVHVLISFHSGLIKPQAIGIITPYSAQTRLISSQLQKLLGPDVASEIEVNTVDGFQGREKEVIIISFVRSNLRGQMGFVQDGRRLNVSLTRAKHSLICVGSHSTLSQADPRSPIPHFARHLNEHVVELSSAHVVQDLGPIILESIFHDQPPEAVSFADRSTQEIAKGKALSGPAESRPQGGRGGQRGNSNSSKRGRGRQGSKGSSSSASGETSKRGARGK
jgi:hypothetical protein